MIEGLLELSGMAAVAVFVLFVIWAVVGSVLEKRVKDPKRFGGMAKMLAFILFVALAFSLVPLLVWLFISMLEGIGFPSAITDALGENDMLIVYAFWALFAIGLAIALPAMRKGGFFLAEKQ